MAYNNWRTSWTYEDMQQSEICTYDNVTEETANFDSCVSGSIITDYGVPYDYYSVSNRNFHHICYIAIL